MMFEELEDLMNRRVTIDDCRKGVFYQTALDRFYIGIGYEDDEAMIVVYETASFPTDGYMPSVKRIAGAVFRRIDDDTTLRDIYQDMVAQNLTRYTPVCELEEWEAEALKDAVMKYYKYFAHVDTHNFLKNKRRFEYLKDQHGYYFVLREGVGSFKDEILWGIYVEKRNEEKEEKYYVWEDEMGAGDIIVAASEYDAILKYIGTKNWHHWYMTNENHRRWSSECTHWYAQKPEDDYPKRVECLETWLGNEENVYIQIYATEY